MSSIWRKDYNDFYNTYKKKTKFVYDLNWCKSFINKYIEIPKNKTSLLTIKYLHSEGEDN